MKIIETNPVTTLEHKPNIEDFTKQVLTRISYICLKEKSFESYKLKLNEIENKVNNIEKKLTSKTKLLEGANTIKLNVVSDMKKLEVENQEFREKLLKLLGSEL